MGSRVPRRGTAALLALVAISLAVPASAERLRHRHSRRSHLVQDDRFVPPPPPSLRERAAAQSGFAFGLLDLGISGAPTAISPYAGLGYGYVGPGYPGPGFGYPGY